MKKLLCSLSVSAFFFSGCTTDAADFKRTMYGARVYPLEGGVFEVVPQTSGSGGGYDYWCAASEYARRYLGAGWQTRFYVYRGMAEGEASGRRSTVLFTLDPVASERQQSGLHRINAFHVGDSMTVQSGDIQCNMFPSMRF